MREIIGDILDMKDGAIFQCVNTLGKMGAGLAKQTIARYPWVRDQYLSPIAIYGEDVLGMAKFACHSVSYRAKFACHSVSYPILVLLYTQKTVGRHGRHTDYDAINSALSHAKTVVLRETTCYFPYKMGCGLGGGDWTRVYQLIQHHFPDGIIVRLPETKG